MADRRLKVLRVDGAEPPSRGPEMLASLPWVGPVAAGVPGETIEAAADQPAVSVETRTQQDAVEDRTQTSAYPAEDQGQESPAIAGRTYLRVDPPEQRSFASERRASHETPASRRGSTAAWGKNDQRLHPGLTVALMVLAAGGMVAWMAFGPGRVTPDLLPGDPLLLGSSDLLPPAGDAQNSEETTRNENEASSESVLPTDPSLEVEPLSAPSSPATADSLTDNEVVESVPPSVAVPEADDVQVAVAAPKLQNQTAPAAVVTPPKPHAELTASVVAETAPTELPESAAQSPEEPTLDEASPEAGYARTAFNPIDNRRMDFSAFRPSPSLTPKVVPTGKASPPRAPLFQP